jgi:hypothetical protein
MQKLLDEIRKGLEDEPLQEVAFGDAPEGSTYLRGQLASGWRLLVVEFDIEDQGFPPGSKGYDGTAAKGATIIRLTRELSELAFTRARDEEAEGSTGG